MKDVSSELGDEASRHDCFLCRPNAALLVDVGRTGYTVAGLGPLVDGYAVVATHEHLRGLAEADSVLRDQYARYAESVAGKLAKKFGNCFVVEHGNMAVCGVSEEGRAHCFHPHFLLIPTTKCSANAFFEYFGKKYHEFHTLTEAIEYGANQGQYVLAGMATGPFYIFLPEGDLPRQFARAIVSEQLDTMHLASWRDMPNPAWASRNAAILRELFMVNDTPDSRWMASKADIIQKILLSYE